MYNLASSGSQNGEPEATEKTALKAGGYAIAVDIVAYAIANDVTLVGIVDDIYLTRIAWIIARSAYLL